MVNLRSALPGRELKNSGAYFRGKSCKCASKKSEKSYFLKKIFTRRGTVGGWEWLIYEVHPQGEN